MENQEILNAEIGTKESIKLKPEKVKIEKVEIQGVGTKGASKVVCSVIHPQHPDLIQISAVKYETNKQLKSIGLWINLDDEKKIRKGSALAVFLSFMNCKTVKGLEGKETMTAEDEAGYLVFKAY